jgi:hypothetical protein
MVSDLSVTKSYGPCNSYGSTVLVLFADTLRAGDYDITPLDLGIDLIASLVDLPNAFTSNFEESEIASVIFLNSFL